MKFLKAIFLASWLAPTVLLAHTELTASTPANGAVINQAPKTLDLTFGEPVQLLKLAITDSSKSVVATTFTPTAATQVVFSVSLPLLKAGTYNVSWTALGDDGHRIENSFTFTVDAQAAESIGPAPTSPTDHKH
jgi:copper resistance protein C